MNIKKAREGLNHLYFYTKSKVYEEEEEVDSSCDAVYEVLYNLSELEETIGCSIEEVFNLFGKEVIVNGNIGCVEGIRKDGETYCLHYYDYINNCDDIEPLSNFNRTFFIVEE